MFIFNKNMLRISPKFETKVIRYFTKNTVRAKYNRNMDLGFWSGLAAGAEVLRMPHWDVSDIGITSMLGTLFLRSIGKASRHLFELQPIRRRAIKIKKAAKLSKTSINTNI